VLGKTYKFRVGRGAEIKDNFCWPDLMNFLISELAKRSFKSDNKDKGKKYMTVRPRTKRPVLPLKC
jgi:hypothetical protein